MLILSTLEFKSHCQLRSKHGRFSQYATVFHIEVQGAVSQGRIN